MGSRFWDCQPGSAMLSASTLPSRLCETLRRGHNKAPSPEAKARQTKQPWRQNPRRAALRAGCPRWSPGVAKAAAKDDKGACLCLCSSTSLLGELLDVRFALAKVAPGPWLSVLGKLLRQDSFILPSDNTSTLLLHCALPQEPVFVVAEAQGWRWRGGGCRAFHSKEALNMI